MDKCPKKTRKSTSRLCQEKLTVDRKNGAAKLDASVIKKADKFCEGYKDFLAHAKTEREARDRGHPYRGRGGLRAV